MKHVTDDELRKQACGVALRRILGCTPAAPIVMMPPPDEAIFRNFTLTSGNSYAPSFGLGGRVIVKSEADAAELEREGWTRKT